MEALTKIGEFFFDDGTLDEGQRHHAYQNHRSQQVRGPSEKVRGKNNHNEKTSSRTKAKGHLAEDTSSTGSTTSESLPNQIVSDDETEDDNGINHSVIRSVSTRSATSEATSMYSQAGYSHVEEPSITGASEASSMKSGSLASMSLQKFKLEGKQKHNSNYQQLYYVNNRAKRGRNQIAGSASKFGSPICEKDDEEDETVGQATDDGVPMMLQQLMEEFGVTDDDSVDRVAPQDSFEKVQDDDDSHTGGNSLTNENEKSQNRTLSLGRKLSLKRRLPSFGKKVSSASAKSKSSNLTRSKASAKSGLTSAKLTNSRENDREDASPTSGFEADQVYDTGLQANNPSREPSILTAETAATKSNNSAHGRFGQEARNDNIPSRGEATDHFELAISSMPMPLHNDEKSSDFHANETGHDLKLNGLGMINAKEEEGRTAEMQESNDGNAKRKKGMGLKSILKKTTKKVENLQEMQSRKNPYPSHHSSHSCGDEGKMQDSSLVNPSLLCTNRVENVFSENEEQLCHKDDMVADEGSVFLTAVVDFGDEQVEAFQLKNVRTRSSSRQNPNSRMHTSTSLKERSVPSNLSMAKTGEIHHDDPLLPLKWLNSSQRSTDLEDLNTKRQWSRSLHSFSDQRPSRSSSYGKQELETKIPGAFPTKEPDARTRHLLDNVRVNQAADSKKSTGADAVELALSGISNGLLQEEGFEEGSFDSDDEPHITAARISLWSEDVSSKATSHKTSEGIEVDSTGPEDDSISAVSKSDVAFIAGMTPRTRREFFAQKIQQIKKMVKPKQNHNKNEHRDSNTEEGEEVEYLVLLKKASAEEQQAEPKNAQGYESLSEPEDNGFMKLLEIELLNTEDVSNREKGLVKQWKKAAGGAFINGISANQLHADWPEDTPKEVPEHDTHQVSIRGRTKARPNNLETSGENFKVKSASEKVRRSLTSLRGIRLYTERSKTPQATRNEGSKYDVISTGVWQSWIPPRLHRTSSPAAACQSKAAEMSQKRKKWNFLSFTLPRVSYSEEVKTSTTDTEVRNDSEPPERCLSLEVQDGGQNAMTSATSEEQSVDIRAVISADNPWQVGLSNIKATKKPGTSFNDRRLELCEPEVDLIHSIQRGMAEPAEGEDDYYRNYEQNWKREQFTKALARKIQEKKKTMLEQCLESSGHPVSHSNATDVSNATKGITFGGVKLTSSASYNNGPSSKKSSKSIRRFANRINGILRNKSPRKYPVMKEEDSLLIEKGRVANYFGFDGYDEDSFQAESTAYSEEGGFLTQQRMIQRSSRPVWNKKFRSTDLKSSDQMDHPRAVSHHNLHFCPPPLAQQRRQSNLQRVLGKKRKEAKIMKRFQNSSETTTNSIIMNDNHVAHQLPFMRGGALPKLLLIKDSSSEYSNGSNGIFSRRTGGTSIRNARVRDTMRVLHGKKDKKQKKKEKKSHHGKSVSRRQQQPRWGGDCIGEQVGNPFLNELDGGRCFR